MAKKSALSIRLSEKTKSAIDKAATKDHRSTASLVEKILADWLVADKMQRPRKYLTASQQVEAGIPLPDAILPATGKRFGDATGDDLKLEGDVMMQLAKKFGHRTA